MVKALQPTDVYPCTTDKTTWSKDVSVEKLFGEYCSGKVFDHDQEMLMILAEKTKIHVRQALEGPCTTKYDHLSIGRRIRRRDPEDEIFPLKPVRPSMTEIGRVDYPAGRPDASFSTLPSLRNKHETNIPRLRSRTILINESASCVHSSDDRMRNLRGSFRQGLLLARKRRNTMHKSSKRIVLYEQRGPQRSSVMAPMTEINRSTHMEIFKGIATEFIEPCDKDDSASEAIGTDANVLLQERPELGLLPSTANTSSQSGMETQTLLSNAWCVSQAPWPVAAEERATRLCHRKDAYMAVKNLGGSWRLSNRLISSGGDHGDEELEL